MYADCILHGHCMDIQARKDSGERSELHNEFTSSDETLSQHYELVRMRQLCMRQYACASMQGKYQDVARSPVHKVCTIHMPPYMQLVSWSAVARKGTRMCKTLYTRVLCLVHRAVRLLKSGLTDHMVPLFKVRVDWPNGTSIQS